MSSYFDELPARIADKRRELRAIAVSYCPSV